MSENKKGIISINIEIDGDKVITTAKAYGVNNKILIDTVLTSIIRTICDNSGISGLDVAMLIGTRLGGIAAAYDMNEGSMKK